MKELLRRLWQDESGAIMVEYGLMIALIAVICIGAVRALGTNVQGTVRVSELGGLIACEVRRERGRLRLP